MPFVFGDATFNIGAKNRSHRGTGAVVSVGDDPTARCRGSDRAWVATRLVVFAQSSPSGGSCHRHRAAGGRSRSGDQCAMADEDHPDGRPAGRQPAGLAASHWARDGSLRTMARIEERSPFVARDVLGRSVVRLQHGSRQIRLGCHVERRQSSPRRARRSEEGTAGQQAGRGLGDGGVAGAPDSAKAPSRSRRRLAGIITRAKADRPGRRQPSGEKRPLRFFPRVFLASRSSCCESARSL